MTTQLKTNVRSSTFALTPSILDYADRRFEKVLTLLGDDPTVRCDIELIKTTSHHNKGDIFRAEVHIVAAGKNVYASAERADLYVAIDAVKDEVMRGLTSGKAKRVSLIRRSGAKVKDMVKGIWPWK